MRFGSVLLLKQQTCAHCWPAYQREQYLTFCATMEKKKSAVVRNAPLLFACSWGNVRMISSEYNNDKCGEHDALAIIYILFNESNIACWVDVRSGTNVEPSTFTRCIRFKIGWEWFNGKLLLNHSVPCSFTHNSAGTCKMIHDVSLLPKPRVHAPLSSECFCCPCTIRPPRENTAHPLTAYIAGHFINHRYQTDQRHWLRITQFKINGAHESLVSGIFATLCHLLTAPSLQCSNTFYNWFYYYSLNCLVSDQRELRILQMCI